MSLNDLGPVAGNQVTVRPPRSNAAGVTRTWHKPCSGPGILDGTTADADMFNDWLAQFRTAFDDAGIAIDGADDMLWRAIQSAGARYATDTGSANNIIVACSPPILSLRVGQVIYVKVAAANSGATTITTDAQPPKAALFSDSAALVAGGLEAGRIEKFIYDGTAFRLSMPKVREFYVQTTPGAIPMSAGVQTLLSPSAVSRSTLVTSTYLNGVFTCGAGEAGLWAFSMNGSFFPLGNAIGSQDAFSIQMIGPQTGAEQGNVQYTGNQGNAAHCSFFERMAVGDTVVFSGFHLQSAGGYGANIEGVRVGA